jgi:hypothetical protein
MGNTFRSTRVLEMAMVNHDSCSPSMARPAQTLATRSQSSPNSDNKFLPTEGWRPRAWSAVNLSSQRSRSASCTDKIN